jgi:hypothetical protein
VANIEGNDCSDCIYWKPLGQTASLATGECCVNPPTRAGEHDRHGVWPVTYEFEWCGKLKTKREWAFGEGDDDVA